METLQNIIENYQHICRTTEKELQKVRQRIRNISLLRLLLFVAAVVGVSYFWGDDWRILLVCAGVPFLAFVWLVKRHNVWFHRKDFLKKKISLTVMSAGIGSELRSLRQYRKLVGSPVEVLLANGVKILAKLDAVDEQGITLSYEEKQTVEGRKRKQLVTVSRTYPFAEIKYTKEWLDFK